MIQCKNVYVYKYVDQTGLDAMLAVKRSAGVTPQVNLRFHCAHVMKHASKGIHPGFETQGK